MDDPTDAIRAFLADVVRPLEAEGRADEAAVARLGRRVREASAEAGIYGEHVLDPARRSAARTALLVGVAARSGSWLARHVVGAGVPGAPSPLLRHARPHVRDHHLGEGVARGHPLCDGGLGSWTPRPPTVDATPVDGGYRLRGSARWIAAEPALALVLADVGTSDETSDERVFLVPRDQLGVEVDQLVLDDVTLPADHELSGSAVELRAEALATSSCFDAAWVLGLARGCHDRLLAVAEAASGKNLGRLCAIADAADRQVQALADRLDAGEHDVALAAATVVTATDAAHQLADAVWLALPDDAVAARLADEVRSLRPRGEAVDALDAAIGAAEPIGSGSSAQSPPRAMRSASRQRSP